MVQLIKLICSETLKLYSRKSTWLMAGFVVLPVFISTAALGKIRGEFAQNIWVQIGGAIAFLFIINLFMVIVAGGIVANEFHWGTIKLLMIRPVSRSRILLAKYLTLLIFGLFLMGLLFGSAWLSNGLFNVVLNRNWEGVAGGGAVGRSIWYNTFGGVLLLYGLRYLETAIYGTFGFMLSTLSKSNTLAVGVSFITMLIGPEFANLLTSGKPWGKFLLFINLDLTRYLSGNPIPFSGMSLIFSTGMLIIYWAVFVAIAWTVFLKRDILN
jgi:ABC-2 type transport system permease protein